jgi:cytochrome oxidase Cu insertion factor (SCO1/SenC/PrrC family)
VGDDVPDTTERRGLPVPSRTQVILTAAAVVAIVAIGLFVAHHRSTTHVATVVSEESSTQGFMGLTALDGRPAPDVDLVDQRGQTVSLSGLSQAGRAVVLEFMDPHCTDICPIISQEFKVAYQSLGARAGQVAFVAVNVNPFHTAQADVAQFTNEQGLDTVPDWYFLTGPMADLRAAWHDYAIAVQAPSPTADVIHSDNMYFIDPSGHERWMALPTDDHTANGTSYLPAKQVHQWGVDIASIASRLLS